MKEQERNYDTERYALSRSDMANLILAKTREEMQKLLTAIQSRGTIPCIACDECRFPMAVTDREFVCYNPKYKNGKRIYRETFGVLKKLGCGSAEKGKRLK